MTPSRLTLNKKIPSSAQSFFLRRRRGFSPAEDKVPIANAAKLGFVSLATSIFKNSISNPKYHYNRENSPLVSSIIPPRHLLGHHHEGLQPLFKPSVVNLASLSFQTMVLLESFPERITMSLFFEDPLDETLRYRENPSVQNSLRVSPCFQWSNVRLVFQLISRYVQKDLTL